VPLNGYGLALALNPGDFIHVITAQQNDDYYVWQLIYGTDVSGDWAKQSIADLGSIFDSAQIVGGLALKRDSAGNLHAAVFNVNGDLVYVTNSSGSWTGDVVDSVDFIHALLP